MKNDSQATGTAGRYMHDGKVAPTAEMTCSVASARLIIIGHTEEPDTYGGQDVGAPLVARTVEDMRTAGKKILLPCTFAAARFRRHPEWQGVVSR